VHGQRVTVEKPRVKRQGRDVELQTHRALRSYDPLNERVMDHMLAGVSTRNYDGLLDELEGGLGLKKSTVSRAFVRGSKQALESLNGRDLTEYEWLAVMIDGIEFSGRHVIVALGITTKGKKLILGLREGDTENSEVVKDLFQNVIDRGFQRSIPFLFVLDGSKALRNAVSRVFGDIFPVQRCVRHKERNVLQYLPVALHGEFRRKWKLIHGMTEVSNAKREYDRLLHWLKQTNLEAANSLREADEETLTVIRLRCPGLLRKTLLSTNPIESAFNGVRYRSHRVKNWRPGSDQIARWSAATLLEVEKRFNLVRGHREIPTFLTDLRKLSLPQEQKVA
jgi:transposase-like protein